MMSMVMLCCGCVADADLINGQEEDDIVIIECPHCGDTFSLADLAEFSITNKPEIRGYMHLAVRTTRPLIQYKGEAFEVHEVCGCGYPIVRKTTDKEGKPKHLRVPPMDTVRLLD